MFRRCAPYLGVIVLIASLAPLCRSDAVKTVQMKQNTILDNILKDYNPRIRPIGVNTSALSHTTADPPPLVTANMYVLTISEVDDTAMDYTMQVYLRLEWNDNRLKYNDDRGTVPSLQLTDVSKLWTPDLFFNNEKEGFQHHLIVPNLFIRIQPNGNVLYSQRLSLTLSCPMSLRWFPFDHQICEMQLESYGSTARELKMRWQDETPVLISSNISLGTFTLESHETTHSSVVMHTGEYQILKLALHLKRCVRHYLISIFIPCTMLVFVSWTTFWLDSGAITARAIIGLTTLFTLAMRVSAFNAALAAVSYTKSVDVWTGVCMTFVFAAFLESIYVNHLSRSEQADKQGGDPSARAAQEEAGGEGVPLVTLASAAAPEGNGRGPKMSLKKRADQYRTRLTQIPSCSAKVDVLSRLVFPIGFALFATVYWLTNFIHAVSQ